MSYVKGTAKTWPYARLSALAVIVTACVGFLTVPARAADPIKVSIGTQIWPGAIPIYVAIANGYTTQQGIDIDKIIVSSGGNRRSALLADEIQFAEFAFSNVAVAVARGARIKYVMSTHDYEMFALIVRSGLKDQVRNVGDLKGRTIGFTTPSAGAWAWARIFTARAGLSPDSDFNFLGGLSETGVVLTALKSGKIDAYPSWEPITTLALNQRIGYPLVAIWEPDVQHEWVGPTALGSGLAATDKIIQEKPDMVRAMVASIKKGLEYINATPPAQVAKLLTTNPRTKEYWGDFSSDSLIEMLDKSKHAFAATSGAISTSGVKSELDLSLKYHIIEKPLAFDSIVDSRFAGTKQ